MFVGHKHKFFPKCVWEILSYSLTLTHRHTHTRTLPHADTHTRRHSQSHSLSLSLFLWRKRLSLSCLDIWFIFTLQTKFLFYLNLQMTTAAGAAAAEFKKLIREQESFSFFASEENKIWFLWKNISSAGFHRQAQKSSRCSGQSGRMMDNGSRGPWF